MPSGRRIASTSLATVVASVLVAVVVSIAAGGGEPAPEDAHITVQEIVNQVDTGETAETGGAQPDYTPAQIGEELRPGSGVKTYQESEARVDVSVRDLIRIVRTAPNTSWRTGQFAVGKDTIFEVDQGKIFLLDDGYGEERRPLKIITPAGTASPRGTILSVSYNPSSGVMDVHCFRGLCQLTNELGTQLLTGGQKSSTTAHTAPTSPQSISKIDEQSFAGLPELHNAKEFRLASRTAPRAATPVPTPVPTPTPVALPETPQPTLTTVPTPRSAPTEAPRPFWIPTSTPYTSPLRRICIPSTSSWPWPRASTS